MATKRKRPGSASGTTKRSSSTGKKKTGSKKNWLKSAINPAHKGYCTPMTKSTCTPRRKALAKRLKPGGDLYKGKKKGGKK